MEDNQNHVQESNTGDTASSNQATEPRVVYYDSYDHGFTNGLLKIPQEHFEVFLQENGQKRLAKISLASVLHSIEQSTQQLAQTWQRLLQLKNTVTSSEHEIVLGETKGMELNALKQEEKSHFERVQKDRFNLAIEYNWLNVGIFIAIGLSFVIADFTITLDVLFHGLDMAFNRAIPLAIAVSGITFVLKPTIDRLFEKPYLRDDKKKKHVLLSLVSILAILVLGLLGYFREEYFKSDKVNQAINLEVSSKESQIQTFKDESSSLKRQGRAAEAPGKDQQALKLEEDTQGLKQKIAENDRTLSGNSALFWIFVLSNILFAIAGAICLSIAFPAADRLRRKRLLRKQQSWLGKRVEQLTLDLTAVQSSIKNHQIARDLASNEIELLPDLSDLEAKHQALLIKLEEIRKESTDHESKAEAALYREAFERGNICEFGDKLIFSTNQISNAIRRGGAPPTKRRPPQTNGSYPNNNGVEESESDGNDRYLHQQIRSLIEYNHRQKKHQLNGQDD